MIVVKPTPGRRPRATEAAEDKLTVRLTRSERAAIVAEVERIGAKGGVAAWIRTAALEKLGMVERLAPLEHDIAVGSKAPR
jgi:hypothetical protein